MNLFNLNPLLNDISQFNYSHRKNININISFNSMNEIHFFCFKNSIFITKYFKTAYFHFFFKLYRHRRMYTFYLRKSPCLKSVASSAKCTLYYQKNNLINTLDCTLFYSVQVDKCVNIYDKMYFFFVTEKNYILSSL